MSASKFKAKNGVPVHSKLMRLELELEYEKEASRQRDEILKQSVITQQMLAEKVIAIQATQEYHTRDITDLKKDTKLQNKVLAAILTSSIATIIGLVAKSVLSSHG